MKEKIIARLRALFPGVNLSKARLDAIADKLKITEESEIDDKLNEANELMDFAAIAKSDDKIRTLEAKVKALTPAPEPEPTPEPTPQPTPTPSPAPTPTQQGPADIQKMITDAVSAAVTPLAQKLSGLEQGEKEKTRLQQLEAKLNGANDVIKEIILGNFGSMKFDTDEAFSEFLVKTETMVSDSNQKFADQGLGGSARPLQPRGGVNGKEASKEEVDSIFGPI